MAKKILKNILLGVFSVFLIIYFLVQMKNIFVASLETENTDLTTFVDSIELKCYIVRDETLVYSDNNGMYNYKVSDGEKLSIGQTIADVFTTDSEYRTQAEINGIDSKINILKESSVEHNYFTLNVSKIDKDIAGNITNFRSNVASGDLSVAVQSKNDLLVTLNKRYLVVNALKGFEKEVELLSDERDSLVSRNSGGNGSIYAPVSGYFYSDTDGFESSLSIDMIERGDYSEIVTALESSSEKPAQKVAGKIVSSFDWYTVCITDADIAQRFQSDTYYELSYPYSVGEKLMSILSQKISSPDSDQVILVFKSISNVESFNFMRSQVVEITLASYSGLMVKKEALRIVDGHEGVYILSGNTVKFKRAYKKYENDGYYIINTVDPYYNERAEYVAYVNAMRNHEKDPDKYDKPKKEVPYIDPYLDIHDAVIVYGKDLYTGKIIG